MSADGLCTPSRYDPKEMTATRPLLPLVVAFPPDKDSPISLLQSPQFSASLLLRPPRALVLATELHVLAPREGGSGRGGIDTGEADLDLDDVVDLDVLVDLDDLDARDDDVQLLMLPRLLLSHAPVDLAHPPPGLVGVGTTAATEDSPSLHWHRMSSRLLSTRRRRVRPAGVSKMSRLRRAKVRASSCSWYGSCSRYGGGHVMLVLVVLV